MTTQEHEYLMSIIKPIVFKPEELSIEQTIDERGVLLSIKSAKEDVGMLIGKAGETARAIRKLVRLYGIINNSRISVKIIEPEHGDLKY